MFLEGCVQDIHKEPFCLSPGSSSSATAASASPEGQKDEFQALGPSVSSVWIFYFSRAHAGPVFNLKEKTERMLGKSLSEQRCLVPGENRSLLFLPQLVRGSVRMKIIRIPSSHTRATIKELEGGNLSTARLVNWIIFMIAKKLDSLAWKMKETRLQLCVISDVNAILWGQPALRDAKWLLCRMPSKLNDIVRPCAKHKTLTQNIRKDRNGENLSWLNSIFTGHNLRKTCNSFG
jgi:hypothetical protein